MGLESATFLYSSKKELKSILEKELNIYFLEKKIFYI